MDSLHSDSVIHGHHIYKDIWNSFVGEILRVEQEAHDTADCFAVAVVKDKTAMFLVKFHALHV